MLYGSASLIVGVVIIVALFKEAWLVGIVAAFIGAALSLYFSMTLARGRTRDARQSAGGA